MHSREKSITSNGATTVNNTNGDTASGDNGNGGIGTGSERHVGGHDERHGSGAGGDGDGSGGGNGGGTGLGGGVEGDGARGGGVAGGVDATLGGGGTDNGEDGGNGREGDDRDDGVSGGVGERKRGRKLRRLRPGEWRDRHNRIRRGPRSDDDSGTGGDRGDDSGRSSARADGTPDAATSDTVRLDDTERPPRKTRTRKARKAKSSEADLMIGLVLGAAFAAPAIALPPDVGAHWPLTEDEQKELAKAVSAALDALPGSRAKKLKAVLGQYAPFGALLITAGTITVPRVMLSRAALKRRHDAERAQAVTAVEEGERVTEEQLLERVGRAG